MEYSAELIKLARAAKTPAELRALAEENQIALSEEQARDLFNKLNRSGALADEELDNVAGGCGKNDGPNAEHERLRDGKHPNSSHERLRGKVCSCGCTYFRVFKDEKRSCYLYCCADCWGRHFSVPFQ